jgi:hypothetical protein
MLAAVRAPKQQTKPLLEHVAVYFRFLLLPSSPANGKTIKKLTIQLA